MCNLHVYILNLCFQKAEAAACSAKWLLVELWPDIWVQIWVCSVATVWKPPWTMSLIVSGRYVVRGSLTGGHAVH
jgi:hypothetical protein